MSMTIWCVSVRQPPWLGSALLSRINHYTINNIHKTYYLNLYFSSVESFGHFVCNLLYCNTIVSISVLYKNDANIVFHDWNVTQLIYSNSIFLKSKKHCYFNDISYFYGQFLSKTDSQICNSNFQSIWAWPFEPLYSSKFRCKLGGLNAFRIRIQWFQYSSNL